VQALIYPFQRALANEVKGIFLYVPADANDHFPFMLQ
jgi:hypothetical protein